MLVALKINVDIYKIYDTQIWCPPVTMLLCNNDNIIIVMYKLVPRKVSPTIYIYSYYIL